MTEHPTLLRPPPPNPLRSVIENDLEVTELSVFGPPWHPPGARGIYGGSVVGMCLAAGQRTVHEDFALHSCHCYFLLAGSADVPLLFHVERVRDGRSFATRTVQARQRGRCIFTVTMSFAKPSPRGAGPASGLAAPAFVTHAAAMPAVHPPMPADDFAGEPIEERFARAVGDDAFAERPVLAGRLQIVGDSGHDGEAGDDVPAHLKRTLQWVRVRGPISAEGGRAAHLAALAYLSDRYFIGTICRIHRLWRFPVPVEKLLAEAEAEAGAGANSPSSRAKLLCDYLEHEGGGTPLETFRGRPTVGMIVSLDHTVYFHAPDHVRADQWMLAEMTSPWAADGRGVVAQRLFSRDGTLLATCVQEGIVRLRDTEAKKSSRENGKKAKI